MNNVTKGIASQSTVLAPERSTKGNRLDTEYASSGSLQGRVVFASQFGVDSLPGFDGGCSRVAKWIGAA